MKQRNQTFTYLGLVIILAALAGLSLLVPPVQAGSALPTRSAPTPTPTGSKEQGTAVATIALEVPTDWSSAWAVVQWQDGLGEWHDVEGWRGWLPDNSRQWVVAQDFATGPFRWVVTAEPEGPVLGASDSFYLPSAANEWLWVTIAP